MFKRLLNGTIIGPLLIWAVFLSSLGTWFVKSRRYAGVNGWPTVEAREVRQFGNDTWQPVTSRYSGTSSAPLNKARVAFSYVVEGIAYEGTRASPNGGGIHAEMAPWRAFYKPDDPGVAVLYPQQYDGTGLLVAALFSGVLCAGHLYFSLRTFD